MSTDWVDYVEKPMKYQALRPQFSPWVGGGGGDGGGDRVGWMVVGGGDGETHSVDMQPCGCFIGKVEIRSIH